MTKPRLLFYAVDGLGLGHVTRLLALARALRRLAPDAEMLFLTASEASHVIYREGFAALKVPSRTAASSGGLRRGTFVRLTQNVVWNAVTAFDPHCIIVDTFPAGALHELLPLLRWPLRKVFVFRAQRAERAADAFLQNTLRLYDLILVPHAPGDEDVPLPDGIPAVWTGPMLGREAADLLPRDQARAALGLPLEGVIGLITLGGGGEPEGIAARQILARALQMSGAPVTGAQAAGTMQGAMPSKGEDGALWVEAEGPLAVRVSNDVPPWPVLRDVHPLMLYLNAFDCAVASVGYNTTHELQAAGVPAILWPFTRDVDDQGARAARLAKMGRALMVGEGTGLGEHAIVAADSPRIGELSGTLAQLMQEDVRRRLRDAMTLAGESAGARWMQGAMHGAGEIMRLLGG